MNIMRIPQINMQMPQIIITYSRHSHTFADSHYNIYDQFSLAYTGFAFGY